jgi:signal transduction histidine kinase
MCNRTQEPAQTSLEERLAREQAARARAERDSRAKDRLLALLVHELRNPLTPIRNAVVILGRQASGDGAVSRALEQLDRQSEYLTRLLEEGLGYSQLVQGRLQLQREQVAVGAVLGRAEGAARPLFDAKQVNLTVSPPPGQFTLQADPARLEQILEVILREALKHTPAGGAVRLETTTEASVVVLRVFDNGPGLAPEVLAHFFDPGAVDDRARPRVAGGAGIGLLLARGLVELHGGALEVHSAGAGQGMEVVVRLPLPEGLDPIH